MRRTAEIIVALVPLAMTPAVLSLLPEHGGSEMDLVWIAPWIVWSAAFALFSFVLIRKRWPWRRRFGSALLFATSAVVILAIGLALAGRLGIAGRF
jgi:small-conductance mechanosensitive channel